MSRRPQRRKIIIVALLVVLFGIYILAKFHFFTTYSTLGTAAYLEEHSVYWLAMAAVALIVSLLEALITKCAFRTVPAATRKATSGRVSVDAFVLGTFIPCLRHGCGVECWP